MAGWEASRCRRRTCPGFGSLLSLLDQGACRYALGAPASGVAVYSASLVTFFLPGRGRDPEDPQHRRLQGFAQLLVG